MRVVFICALVAGLAALGFWGYKNVAGTYGTYTASATIPDSQSLAQIQQQLNNIEKRLDDLEKRRKTDAANTRADANVQETPAPSPSDIPHPRTQYQISPAYAVQAHSVAPQSQPADSASPQALAKIQEGIGTLQQQTTSNQEAWQATTNRLAEVAGELGTQHGQVIQNQEELNQFLARAKRSTFTFELRRSSDPEVVGPVQLSLQSSNQKSRRYTLCVYVQGSCVQVKDRGLYEVVQLTVSPDTDPLELIATRVGKDQIVGYLEVPGTNPSR